MHRHRSASRLVSVAVAAAMMMPALAAAAAAATGTWLAPQPGQKLTARNVEVSVGYNTQSDVRVTRLELWIDGRRNTTRSLARPESRGVCSFWWDTARSSRGAHRLSVKIFAGNELLTTVSGTGTIGEAGYDLRAPNVHFADISSGDVLKGVASVRMVVTDDGAEPPIVSLLVDNTLKFLTNRKPCVYSLDTTKYTDGEHELQTFAYDSAGNKSDPAVVKVAFRNGIEKPIVAAMNVERVPGPVAPSEDDGVGKLLPPLTSPSVEPDARTRGAARASEPEAHANKPAVAAHPVARKAAVKPAAKPAAAPSIAKPVASEPSAVRVAAAVPQHKPAVGEAEPGSSAMAVKPSVALSVPPSTRPPVGPASAVAPEAKALPAQPALKQADSAREARQVGPPAEPRTVTVKPIRPDLAPPTAGKPKPVVVGTTPATRAAKAGSVAGTSTGGVAPRVLAEPSGSTPRGVSVPRPTPRLRDSRVALSTARPTPRAPQAPVGKAGTAEPRPIRAAMLPTLRGGDHSSSAQSGIICPPPVRQDTKALLEKRLMSAKGKTKLRDLVNDLGGVVFWDTKTHTATAYVQNLEIEVQIGSSVVKVNGKTMSTDLLPRIANDRTIIDAQLYAQACAFAERGAASGSARAR